MIRLEREILCLSLAMSLSYHSPILSWNILICEEDLTISTNYFEKKKKKKIFSSFYFSFKVGRRSGGGQATDKKIIVSSFYFSFKVGRRSGGGQATDTEGNVERHRRSKGMILF